MIPQTTTSELDNSAEPLSDELIDPPTPTTSDVRLPCSLDDFLSKRGGTPSRNDERRRFARIYYRHPTTIHYRQSLPSFPREVECATGFTCDVSRSGLQFLADRELYPKEKVDIELPSLGRKTVQVVRCRRLGERCFEIGAVFG